VDRADVLVALNQPSLVRFRPLLVDGGLLIVNTSLADAPPADGAQVLGLPCSRLAALSGDDRVMSTVALGALLACRPIMPVDAARRALVAVVGEGRDALLVANVSAFDRGYEAALAAHGAAAA
jgi:2-oxoglutarate ferredoxin oxidoreductase subunit gamma